jgi:hypothetical protein
MLILENAPEKCHDPLVFSEKPEPAQMDRTAYSLSWYSPRVFPRIESIPSVGVLSLTKASM